MEYVIVSNNPKCGGLVNNKKVYQVTLIDGSVKDVLSKCEELLSTNSYSLAADLMGGRRARPFPFLTAILKIKGGPPTLRDWKRIIDYADLDNQRMSLYSNFDKRMLDDYSTLDYSLTISALQF